MFRSREEVVMMLVARTLNGFIITSHPAFSHSISSSVFLEMGSSSSSPAPSSVFLGVDIGTGNARADIFDEKGKLLGSAYSPIQIWKEGDFVEQPSTGIWHAVYLVVKSACALAQIKGEEVKGIGFVASCSLVAVDANGSPVTVSWSGVSRRNIIVWMDHRAVKQAKKINSCNSPYYFRGNFVILPGRIGFQGQKKSCKDWK
ncbi:hypothetical protein CCACVL1_29769 [Corchorus capsularis]|uniref:Carbohydrate kinase FGGY N-terminal domain-containing protein n=1 Tax=Corchorus capsularis TaxID=210143 RepID=A0A1R3G088_COCAP|nr:hypothetical protein CCACVL1_29769 [Corchorus capsularis]